MTNLNDQTMQTDESIALSNAFIDAMARVYLWMAGGLMITAAVALFVSQNETLSALVLGKPWIIFGLFGVGLVLVMGITSSIDSMAPRTALGLFFLYSAVMGASLSTVFMFYSLGTIFLAFGVTSIVFVCMAGVGLITRKDLTSMQPILIAGVFGLIIASFANVFLQSGTMEAIVSFLGVIIFMALTAHDSNKIKAMTAEALAEGETEVVGRIGVMGALALYLDLVNMFLFILSIMGNDD